MATLFISDLHLDDSRPHTTRLLLDFLAGTATRAEALYILGDLFEYWIGDDAVSSTARAVAKGTAALSSQGVPCYFLHGNRDFLLGKTFAGLARMQLLPESLVIDLYGTPTLILHGDTLCTDDREYQVFREQSRDPAWREAVLAKSVEERIQLAVAARDASMEHTGSISMDIMDVNDSAVRKAFRDHAVSRLIHGHTHRPNVHHYRLGDGRMVERFVLGDWYEAGSYLSATSEGIEALAVTG